METGSVVMDRDISPHDVIRFPRGLVERFLLLNVGNVTVAPADHRSAHLLEKIIPPDPIFWK